MLELATEPATNCILPRKRREAFHWTSYMKYVVAVALSVGGARAAPACNKIDDEKDEGGREKVDGSRPQSCLVRPTSEDGASEQKFFVICDPFSIKGQRDDVLPLPYRQRDGGRTVSRVEADAADTDELDVHHHPWY